jgi:hypothetical protein
VGWALLVGSAVLVAAFVAVERWVTARDGSPIVPGRVLRLRGFAPAVGAVFLTMSVFGGFFFAFAVHLQGGLGDSALRAGLTFAPAAAAFAVVSLNWRRLPDRLHEALIVAGFLASAASLLGIAALVHGGSRGGGCHLPGGDRVWGGDGSCLQPAADPHAAGRAGGGRS